LGPVGWLASGAFWRNVMAVGSLLTHPRVLYKLMTLLPAPGFQPTSSLGGLCRLGVMAPACLTGGLAVKCAPLTGLYAGVVMPNHVHGIIVITADRISYGRSMLRPYLPASLLASLLPATCVPTCLPTGECDTTFILQFHQVR